MSKRLLFALVALFAYQVWLDTRPPLLAASPPVLPTLEFDGSLDPDRPPLQTALRGGDAFRVKNYTITPLATFQVAGRVLSTERYRFDRAAELSPIDFAMGWGPMADPTLLRNFNISQNDRFYFYSWSNDSLALPPREIARNSANMHMIPANAVVARALKDVEADAAVRFKGFLVNVDADDGWRWRSSLSRDDTGNGACEVVVVDSIEVL